MPYRLPSISPEPIAEAEVNVPAPFFFVMPTQATVLPSTYGPTISAQAAVLKNVTGLRECAINRKIQHSNPPKPFNQLINQSTPSNRV